MQPERPRRISYPVIRSSSYGWVVENFIGPNVYTGEDSAFITKNGKVCIFPDYESIPPKWREHAKRATQQEVLNGILMPRVINVQKEEVLRKR